MTAALHQSWQRPEFAGGVTVGGSDLRFFPCLELAALAQIKKPSGPPGSCSRARPLLDAGQDASTRHRAVLGQNRASQCLRMMTWARSRRRHAAGHCNPHTDRGRGPLDPHRLHRHCQQVSFHCGVWYRSQRRLEPSDTCTATSKLRYDQRILSKTSTSNPACSAAAIRLGSGTFMASVRSSGVSWRPKSFKARVTTRSALQRP